MSAAPLPQRVTIAEAVSQGRKFVGSLKIASLERLADAILPSEGDLQVALKASEVGHALGRITGSIDGTVQMTCQRCLQATAVPLTAQADWTLVGSEADEERLLESYDPVLVQDGQFDLMAAIEDEAILALPLVPLCVDGECAEKLQANDAELVHNRRPIDANPNPFAALKGQLKN